MEDQLARTVETMCRDPQLVGVYFMDIIKNSLSREDAKEERVIINPTYMSDPKIKIKRSEHIAIIIAICEAT